MTQILVYLFPKLGLDDVTRYRFVKTNKVKHLQKQTTNQHKKYKQKNKFSYIPSCNLSGKCLKTGSHVDYNRTRFTEI